MNKDDKSFNWTHKPVDGSGAAINGFSAIPGIQYDDTEFELEFVVSKDAAPSPKESVMRREKINSVRLAVR